MKKQFKSSVKISSKRFNIINEKLNNRESLVSITLYGIGGTSKKTMPINDVFTKDAYGKELSNKVLMEKLDDFAFDLGADSNYMLD